ncbi:serine/threonine-protein kinase [Allorhizocola rhizosphaerae]|uniref:serine/threonine-protein kinase n=1 Tax=Allorhizocola rhizosphaerae TaxID=1872709 RepID=UPI000E3CF557|nr:serine/threonine-protein kinase [Allorhizocola rhizosphaerae]
MHSPSRAAPGAIVGGRYALRTAIGHGGMGTVWRATDTILRREVAVKEVVLPPGLALSDQEAMYERTLREARAAAGLSHPSIVQVFDVVTEDGRPWIVMELLDARSLADMVLEDGPIAPRAVAKIGIALLGALEIAHAGGVLHRDVKPANVLITKEGRCVLTDFGVAKLPTDVQLTTPGMVLGSPHFISPERALGHRFGPPSDLFSLGVTLYTAVEGRPPFDKGDPLATMHSVVEDPPVPPQRCGPLIDVLYGLMEKDPQQRWDVATSRGVLRELLAGPLAQNTHPQHVTDPYAVVPQPPVVPPVYADTRADRKKQVGGRAMLKTGEMPAARSGQRHTTSALPAITAGEPKRAQPNRMRIALGVGAAMVVLMATAAWAILGRDPDKSPQTQPSAGQQPSTATVAVPKAEYQGIIINMPEGWKKKNDTQNYLDLHHPEDRERWLRLRVDPAERNAMAALQYADANHTFCSGGDYAKLGLTAAKLGGVDGAQLEFTCTLPGKAPRHGLWRVAIINGAGHHLYLQTWDANFAQDKQVFEAALASFAVKPPTG